jgi:nitrite reductase (NADH) large subunit
VTEEILGDNLVKGIKLKDDQILEADIVLIQAGIRPTIELAEISKLETNRGIIVNEILQTSNKDIFAAGDCIEYKSQTWGIIPACIEQSRIVASSVLGKKEIQYKGTTPKTTLKIVGIDLCSVGIFNPPSEDEPGWEILKKVDKQGGCYQKIVLKDGTLKGAILFGEKKTIPYVNKNINLKVKREEINDLLEVLMYYCPGCGYVYDEAKEELKFEMLPDNWKCPGCKAPKSAYKVKDN